MPILGLESTQFISEGYWQHAFNYLGCRNKYADIGSRTNTVYFRRLLARRVQLRGLQKEICRYWDSTQHRLFAKATSNTRSTTWAAERNMPLLGFEPHSLLTTADGKTRSTTWAAERNMPILGIEPHSLFLKANSNKRSSNWAAERNMPVLGANQHSLLPKTNGNTRSTNCAAEINMPILGLEQTQFISEGNSQHAFNYLGCRNQYPDIGTRNNTV